MNMFFTEYLRTAASGFNLKLKFFDGYSRILTTTFGTTCLVILKILTFPVKGNFV